MPLFHYPKGSPEAKLYMAKLRAMRGKSGAHNPPEWVEALHRRFPHAQDAQKILRQIHSGKSIEDAIRHVVGSRGSGAHLLGEPEIKREAEWIEFRRRGKNPLTKAQEKDFKALQREAATPEYLQRGFSKKFRGGVALEVPLGELALTHNEHLRIYYSLRGGKIEAIKGNEGFATHGLEGKAVIPLAYSEALVAAQDLPMHRFRIVDRAGNPLDETEATKIKAAAAGAFSSARAFRKMPTEQVRAGYQLGRASGLSHALHVAGSTVPDRQNGYSDEFDARREAGSAIAADKSLHEDLARKKNPHPMLVLGNPPARRVNVKKNPDGSFEALVSKLAKSPTSEVRAAVAAHPRCVRELKAYRSRHGSGPVSVKVVMVPDGYPWVASSWGKSPNVVYDAPRHSNKGKRIHHFGEGGGKKPDLISSTEKGPKFLAFADGTFRADGEWILK